ncbi:hypothetical protein E2C01_010156 [Portunus trituberculatus]|uniref:Uncharacterized protein n=1 Tax=Portunus trituberculatus TaxID=210409 RepID=A0A5B7D7P9_PORTR|nr:hypothetical protein [Portunus trituberculatus]
MPGINGEEIEDELIETSRYVKIRRMEQKNYEKDIVKKWKDQPKFVLQICKRQAEKQRKNK